MKYLLALAALLAIISTASAVTRGLHEDRHSISCEVNDPGYPRSPLNVRTVPNGTILYNVPNELDVVIWDRRIMNGKEWVYITSPDYEGRPYVGIGGTVGGWVYRDYLFCYQTG
jgi:hypothetical protein